MTPIHTSGAEIRLIERTDVAALQRFYERNSAHLSRWGSKGRTFDKDHLTVLLERWEHQIIQGTALRFIALERKALEKGTMEIVATINFFEIRRAPFHACKIGYAVDQAFEGQGLMYKILSALLPNLFATENLHRIEAIYNVRNIRSERLLKRLGFQQEGILRQFMQLDGEWQDHILATLIDT
ncbi:Ribosomal protein S5-alanine N-acetyltransferase [Halomonadaceae bacterium LMG 33818]|uniref:GNAT family N-acetyltransferase n=1 Tax=Cernens ardua TaxID=3402176 RepID=UPI003EDC53BC